MRFNPDNPVIQLCSEGMAREMQRDHEGAAELFQKAWSLASNDFEKFTAAHYVARHQKSAEEKLEWDQRALEHALKIEGEEIKGSFPSLYLNIGKCYEDLGQVENAKEYYEQALAYAEHLPDDEYGKMTKDGVKRGIERIAQTQ